ncbi:cytochrome c [Aliishimia ponticola]|uniref:Cytochrome c n=1 Tax=Aliishimia ponticola TaxID=2499833 RepID=A0A4S4NGP4_9RHOB|nr:cytochrome c [Aliishimia ponticola]THH37338.1 cytochrome c [Aliishimia ponticola]
MRYLTILATLLALSPALAQEAEIGAEIYQENCATCHGIEGDGKGPMAPVLLVQPSDLTSLTRRHDGQFPLLRVVMRIDGREPLVSHGSDMPIFGEFFEGVHDVPLKTAAGQPMLVSQPIADLVAYLKEIQQ